MLRLLLLLITTVMLAGCGSIQSDRLLDASSNLLERTGQALGKIGEPTPQNNYAAEIEPLFEQPYIDPLTEYLQRYEGDSSRASQLQSVRRERDSRCAAIAERYASRPATPTALRTYRAGYQFSCPVDVQAYATEARKLAATKSPPPTPKSSPRKAASAAVPPPSPQLRDCYLLTSIRNFSEALKACKTPAENGDAQAQTNMALIAYTFQNYDSAARWARKAASQSGNACYLLGQMYEAGEGVEQSRERARKWYTKAAVQGHAAAKAALGASASISSGENVN